jgi:glucokinase-like ROK family protein
LIITGDQYLVKKLNKSIVLETIKNKHPLSRAQISEMTGLNKGTVSTLVNELIAENFVYEIGPGVSSGGRRPVMLLFNKVAGYAIGVDLGVNYILTILTNLQGEIVAEKMEPLHDLTFEVVISKLISSIESMFKLIPESTYGIVGIGIGIPGIIDDQGTVLFAPNLGWENTNIKEIIASKFNLPVTINNEANAGALGEKLFGIGKNVSNLIYVSAGIGIGTGIILNNELYKGGSGFSGEMGHFTIEVNGKKCRCGNKGCWELYASENALLEQAKGLSIFHNTQNKEISLEELVQLADQGNKDVIHLFNTIGEYLGIGLTNIINTFNPELIIIGNRLTVAEKWIINPIKRVIESRSLPFHQKGLNIEFSNLKTYSCALGASSMAISNFFSNNQISVENPNIM